jgi:hypothetical protein
MTYAINFSDEFRDWFDAQQGDLQDTILMHIRLLEQYGPQLSRPYADTLANSKLRKLRVKYRGEPYRLLYAFDPKR